MTAISYHHTFDDLQDLRFVGGCPFARPEWFARLEKAGSKPLIALARSDHEAVALPLAEGPGGLEPLTNWYAFTWRELATPAAELDDLLACLARDLAGHADRLVLSKLPDEDGTATRLERAFRKGGWIVQRQRCDSNHALDIAGRSYAEYLTGRPAPLRATLGRKAGNLEIEILEQFSTDAWNVYERVYAESWKRAEGDPALLRAFAEAEGAAGRLRFGLARHDDEVVAAQFWTVEGGTAWIHKLVHRESAQSLSPGTVLTAALLERVVDVDRVEHIDFGTGSDPFKRAWMEQVRPRFRLTCWRPGVPRNWPAIGQSWLRRLVSGARTG